MMLFKYTTCCSQSTLLPLMWQALRTEGPHVTRATVIHATNVRLPIMTGQHGPNTWGLRYYREPLPPPHCAPSPAEDQQVVSSHTTCEQHRTGHLHSAGPGLGQGCKSSAEFRRTGREEFGGPMMGRKGVCSRDNRICGKGETLEVQRGKRSG